MPLALLVAAVLAGAPAPSRPFLPQSNGAAKRAAVPAGDELDGARRLVVSVFEIERRSAPGTERSAQQALVRELREHARTNDSYPPSQVYALLVSGAEVAERIGDCHELQQCIVELGSRFQVDGATLLAEAAMRVGRAAPSVCPPVELLPLLLESGRALATTDTERARVVAAEAERQLQLVDESVRERAGLQQRVAALRDTLALAGGGTSAAAKPSAPAQKVDVPPTANADRARTRAAIATIVAGLEGKLRRDKLPVIRSLVDKGAAGSAEPPGSRYEYLVAALDAAGNAGDVETIVRAGDELDAQFLVDRLQLQFEAGRKAQEAKTGDAVKLVRLFIDVCAACVDNRPGLGNHALKAANAERERLRGSRKEFDEASARIRELTDRLADLEREKTMRATLAKTPDDVAAIENLGWFLCLRRNKWAEGLPMLAKGSIRMLGDRPVHAVAKQELDKASTDQQVWELAEAWRAFAELGDTPPVERSNVVQHVRELYRRLSGIKDLRRKRIDDYLAPPGETQPKPASTTPVNPDAGKVASPPDDGKGERANQSRTWFRTGKVVWGPQNWSITDQGVTTPSLNAAATSQHENNCMLVSGKPMRGPACVSVDFPVRAGEQTMFALAFGVKGAEEGYLAEVTMTPGPFHLRVYRYANGQTQLLAEQAYASRTKPPDFATLLVTVRGKEIVAKVGEQVTVTLEAPAEVEGNVGIYVSGSTRCFEPIELRNFHVGPP